MDHSRNLIGSLLTIFKKKKIKHYILILITRLLIIFSLQMYLLFISTQNIIFILYIGTFSSGMLCLCVGKPRFTVNDTFQSRVGAFCVNFVVAAAQLFTVLFCLVGWGWSIWWGVIMLKMASKSSLQGVHLYKKFNIFY